ncbi:MAG: hypothetical protein QNJ63_18620 [Calothrix sp. MO_192.B10]|nr:hypothetical protein [Calothrix sp. MO_192.B10]
MQKTQNHVFTPSASAICDRVLGFFVANYSRLTIMGNQFPEKRLEKYQAHHYIYTSILTMFEPKKRTTSLSQKPKRKNSRLWKIRQRCKFWQPIVGVIVPILVFLVNLFR